MSKQDIIFVGSFLKESQSGGVGGQMFACKSLVESELSDLFNWLKIDSTAETNLHRSLLSRTIGGLRRLWQLIKILRQNPQARKVLIFTSSGMSLVEKGVMAIISHRLFGKKVVLAPRSGRIEKDLKSKMKRKFISKVFQNCEYIICQGDYWKRMFEKVFPEVTTQKYIVIKNWIDNDVVNGKDLGNVAKVNGQILYLGWLEKEKGVFDLLEVAKKMRDAQMSFHIVMGGDGVEKDRIVQEVELNDLGNHVSVKGWIKGKEKRSLLASSEVFVLPTYFEGMPNSVIEAMSFGIPCVTTEVGAIPDLITSGTNGLLCVPGDVDRIYRNISKLLEDKEMRDSMGKKARESISRDHLLSGVIPKFKKILLDEADHTRP